MSARWILHSTDPEERIEIVKALFTAGRSTDVDIICRTRVVSRNHAEFIVLQDGTLHIRDKQSANGTFVNKQKIETNVLRQLHVNDEVGLGTHSASSLTVNTPRARNRFIYIVEKEEGADIVNNDEDDNTTNSGAISTQCKPDINVSTNVKVSHVNVAKQSHNINSNASTSAGMPKMNGIELSNINANALSSKELLNVLDSQYSFSDEININVNKTDKSVSGIEISTNSSKNKTVSKKQKQNCAQQNSITKNKNTTKCDKSAQPSTSAQGKLGPKEYRSEAQVKQEPNEVDQIQNGFVSKYRVEDDYIVIEDDSDEDNDDFPCSQLLQNDVPKTHVDEPRGINDSIFCAIKSEVEELDRVPPGTVLNTVLVDSDGEELDWLGDIQNDRRDENKNEVSNKNDAQTDEAEKSDACKADSTKSSLNSWKGKKKYVKPPIIEAHEEKSGNRRKNHRLPVGATPTKRKIEKESENCKKIKTDTFYNKKADKESSLKRKSKEVIQDIRKIERKMKLKEIAVKANQEEKVKKREKNKTAAAAKVKVSDSRGKFLTEHEMPSTSKGIKSNSTSVKRKNNGSSTSATSKKRVLPPKNVTSNQLPPQPKVNYNGTIRNGELLSSELKQTEITRNNVITHYNREQNGVHNGNLGSFNNHVTAEWQNIEDIILQMLHWNVYWFEERKQNESWGMPPINKAPLNRMARNFSSYTDYAKTVLPLLMVELWYFLYKEIDNAASDPRKKCFRAILEEETPTRKFTMLDCVTYITKEQNNDHMHVKEEDVVILQYRFDDNGQVKTMPFLGYVTHVTKRLLNGEDFIDGEFADTLEITPQAVISFKVMIKLYKGTAKIRKYVKLRIATSIVSTLRIFKSVKHLEHSDLCQHVLRPSIDLYKISNNFPNKQLFSKDNLNLPQRNAVLEASHLCTRNEPGIFLIQGPPGTGKTKVIVNIVQQVLFHNLQHNNKRCILVVAPSNGAVDELVLRLINSKSNFESEYRKELKLVRLGPKNVISPAVQNYALYEIAKRTLISELLRQVPENARKQINQLTEYIESLKKTHDPKKPMSSQAYNKLMKAIKDLERFIRKLVGSSYNERFKRLEETSLDGARIICTTLSSCVGIRMSEVFGGLSKKICCCIIDEATQSNEQESLIPLKLGINKLVLVGDPKQLPAVTIAKEAKDYGFGQSLFSRISRQFQGKPQNPIRMLNIQYRMHPEICHYPNKEFYNGELTNSESILNRNSLLNVLVPYKVFNFDVDFCNSQEYKNKAEIHCVIKLIEAIISSVPQTFPFSVGVITPYNVQKQCIVDELKRKIFKSNISITANTVDSFQGQEKDIIIMSCVRINSNNFLRDEHRLNVALTRAKFALYIIGSANLFETCEVFGKIGGDAKKRRLLTGVNARTTTTQLSKLITVSK